VTLSSGAGTASSSGTMTVSTSVAASGSSGWMLLSTGSASAGPSGTVSILSGATTSTFSAGHVVLSGGTAGGTGVSGSVSVLPGAGTNTGVVKLCGSADCTKSLLLGATTATLTSPSIVLSASSSFSLTSSGAASVVASTNLYLEGNVVSVVSTSGASTPSISILSGDGDGGGSAAGTLTLQAGGSPSATTAGATTVSGGAASGSGNGGALALNGGAANSGAGGSVTISGGTSASGTPGSVIITASGSAVASMTGGNAAVVASSLGLEVNPNGLSTDTPMYFGHRKPAHGGLDGFFAISDVGASFGFSSLIPPEAYETVQVTLPFTGDFEEYRPGKYACHVSVTWYNGSPGAVPLFSCGPDSSGAGDVRKYEITAFNPERATGSNMDVSHAELVVTFWKVRI
jgi:hypothetical protein